MDLHVFYHFRNMEIYKCVMFNVNDSMINIIKADLYILKVHVAAYKLIISQLLKMNRWWKCTTLDCFIKLKEVHLDKLSWDINIQTQLFIIHIRNLLYWKIKFTNRMRSLSKQIQLIKETKERITRILKSVIIFFSVERSHINHEVIFSFCYVFSIFSRTKSC